MKKISNLSSLKNEIQQRYEGLSKRLKQVAEYILDNGNNIAFDTVAEIAKQANVPPSTLIRFANTLGFSGFNDIKNIFRENLIENTPNYAERLLYFHQLEADSISGEAIYSEKNILNILSQANSQALLQFPHQIPEQDLKLAIEILKSAHNIFIIGLKRSFSVACYLDYALHHLNFRSFLVNGLGGMFDEQISQVRDGDVIVTISFSPYAIETSDITKIAAKKGIKQIAITDSQLSPLIPFSDVTFTIKEAQIKGFRSQCLTMNLIQSLVIALASQQNMPDKT